MNTLGQILREERIKKGFSLTKLSRLTKIRKDFISMVEKEDWDNLPEFPVVSGFVKNLAVALGLLPDKLVAILRRDYLPRKLTVNPKPDIEKKFLWSPKATFVLGVSFLAFLVLGYLGFEYFKFTRPPELVVDSPKEGEIFTTTNIKIEGHTTSDAVLTVNNQPITLDDDGRFTTEIKVTEMVDSLKFISVSRSEKTTEKIVKIFIE